MSMCGEYCEAVRPSQRFISARISFSLAGVTSLVVAVVTITDLLPVANQALPIDLGIDPIAHCLLDAPPVFFVDPGERA